jgi:competence protein ComGF
MLHFIIAVCITFCSAADEKKNRNWIDIHTNNIITNSSNELFMIDTEHMRSQTVRDAGRIRMLYLAQKIKADSINFSSFYIPRQWRNNTNNK